MEAPEAGMPVGPALLALLHAPARPQVATPTDSAPTHTDHGPSTGAFPITKARRGGFWTGYGGGGGGGSGRNVSSRAAAPHAPPGPCTHTDRQR
ncbi:hypothetical protein E2C01_087855 [Portunus trituberculatus]|uniref:Uncharacterized protein n=1 Tax=Portunus trituberculatus TaxID=210409 RepID=A0A5B7JCZ1_PORTR|nr:hypothetical protein [Portunus trituberculatus]